MRLQACRVLTLLLACCLHYPYAHAVSSAAYAQDTRAVERGSWLIRRQQHRQLLSTDPPQPPSSPSPSSPSCSDPACVVKDVVDDITSAIADVFAPSGNSNSTDSSDDDSSTANGLLKKPIGLQIGVALAIFGGLAFFVTLVLWWNGLLCFKHCTLCRCCRRKSPVAPDNASQGNALDAGKLSTLEGLVSDPAKLDRATQQHNGNMKTPIELSRGISIARYLHQQAELHDDAPGSQSKSHSLATDPSLRAYVAPLSAAMVTEESKAAGTQQQQQADPPAMHHTDSGRLTPEAMRLQLPPPAFASPPSRSPTTLLSPSGVGVGTVATPVARPSGSSGPPSGGANGSPAGRSAGGGPNTPGASGSSGSHHAVASPQGQGLQQQRQHSGALSDQLLLEPTRSAHRVILPPLALVSAGSRGGGPMALGTVGAYGAGPAAAPVQQVQVQAVGVPVGLGPGAAPMQMQMSPHMTGHSVGAAGSMGSGVMVQVAAVVGQPGSPYFHRHSNSPSIPANAAPEQHQALRTTSGTLVLQPQSSLGFAGSSSLANQASGMVYGSATSAAANAHLVQAHSLQVPMPPSMPLSSPGHHSGHMVRHASYATMMQQPQHMMPSALHTQPNIMAMAVAPMVPSVSAGGAPYSRSGGPVPMALAHVPSGYHYA